MKKRWILILVVLVLIGTGGYWWKYKKVEKAVEVGKVDKIEKTKEKKDFGPREIVLPNQMMIEKEAVFFIKIEKQDLTVGESMDLKIMVNGKGKKIDGVEFVLVFNPMLVKAGEPIKDEFFSLYPQLKVDNEKGIIRVIALQGNEEDQKLDEAVVVSLPITALEKGKANFVFDKAKCQIAGYGGQEMLRKTKGITININP